MAESTDLSKLTHAELYRLRAGAPAELQAEIAPFEHRAFAREATAENPLLALPIALATPLYAAAKALGLVGARTPASLRQVGYGLAGVGEGLAEYLAGRAAGLGARRRRPGGQDAGEN